MTFPVKLIIIVSLVTSIRLTTVAQESNGRIETVDSYFDKIIGIENSGIINGRQYRMGQLGAKSNPFFRDGESPGVVKYDGDVYHVSLLYDLVQDQVIVKYISAQGMAWFIQLEKDLVDEFSISDRRFRRFDRGFYEVLFEGDDVLILARRSKEGKTEQGSFNYLSEDSYFLVDAGKWNPLRNAMSVAGIIENKNDRKAVKSFIQERGVKIRKFKPEDLSALGTFLVQLKKAKRL